MSLRDLDAFLEHARRTPELQSQLNGPLELEALLELAAAEGYPLCEADVLAAQEREEAQLSDQELQQRAGVDARKLRSFVHS